MNEQTCKHILAAGNGKILVCGRKAKTFDERGEPSCRWHRFCEIWRMGSKALWEELCVLGAVLAFVLRKLGLGGIMAICALAATWAINQNLVKLEGEVERLKVVTSRVCSAAGARIQGAAVANEILEKRVQRLEQERETHLGNLTVPGVVPPGFQDEHPVYWTNHIRPTGGWGEEKSVLTTNNIGNIIQLRITNQVAVITNGVVTSYEIWEDPQRWVPNNSAPKQRKYSPNMNLLDAERWK